MKPIEVLVEGPVTRIILNRPEKSNALTAEMMHIISAQIRDHDHSDGVLVLEARGDKGFSAGADIEEVAEGRAALARQEAGMISLAEALLASQALKIVVLHGYARGGGALFPCLGDIVFAREDVTLSLPEIRFGMYPVLLHALLLERVPNLLAWQLCATGRVLHAAEAHDFGLITEILPAHSFREIASEKIAQYTLLRGPLALGKKMAVVGLNMTLSERLTAAGQLMHENYAMPGVREIVEQYRATITSGKGLERARRET